MSLVFAILIYAASMTLANLTVAHFGPTVIPINAFVLIGLDLTLRDWLHVRLKPWQMGALIAATSLLTLALNPSAGSIALASAVAFGAAALVDWAVFARLQGTWTRRSIASNVAGACVDSLVFPLLAFGGLDWKVVVPMFVAKTVGSTLWAAGFAIVKRRTSLQALKDGG